MASSIRFLVVDDFWTMRRIIKNFLTDPATNITEADDGKTALPVLKSVVDFITDWNIGMPGLELLGSATIL
jgi:CheY-like chemotaxis protein